MLINRHTFGHPLVYLGPKNAVPAAPAEKLARDLARRVAPGTEIRRPAHPQEDR